MSTVTNITKNTPKLLIINVTCNQGSTGKIAEQVGCIMKKEGWDVYYAHGARRVNPSELNTIPFSNVRDEYLHALKALLFDACGLGSVNTTKKLINQIEQIKPDIIHIHNINGYYINYKLLFEYLNSSNIPIIATLHSCWYFTGHCSYFDYVKCEKWKSECNHCPLVGLSNMALVDRSKRNYTLKKFLFSHNKNLNIVPVSNWLGNLARQSFLKEKNIYVIRNGIDLNVFKPYAKSISNKFRILGVSNKWDERKGLTDILKLRNILPVEKYDIILVGLSTKQIKKLPAGIIGIRNTANQKELAKLYSDADVFINTTYADTFPTVNLESMACGTPVITYNTGGSPESLTDDTGIVVEKGNIQALSDAIIKIKNNSDESKYSTKICRKHAVENFDKDKCFNEYSMLFNSIINNKTV